MKKLLLITGDLACGKTTFAKLLSKRYDTNLYFKDSLKELLGDAIGFTNREENLKLSKAAVQVMVHIFSEFAPLGKNLILEANFRTHELWYQRFGEERVELTKEELGTETKGHGGGDIGLVKDVLRYYRGEEFDSSSITLIDRSVESHYMAFAAEASRVAGGELVRMNEFKEKIGAK